LYQKRSLSGHLAYQRVFTSTNLIQVKKRLIGTKYVLERFIMKLFWIVTWSATTVNALIGLKSYGKTRGLFSVTRMVETVRLLNDEDNPEYRKHTRLTIGTLVEQRAHEYEDPQPEDLNRWATIIRETFLEAFNETWSIVLYTGAEDYCAWTNWWCELELCGLAYSIKGSPYENAAPETSWTTTFHDFFTVEFECQQWVAKCEPIGNSLRKKFNREFRLDVSIVVVRGGVIGGDVVGESFNHSGQSVWIAA
jgi:hypothetical protein